MKVHLCFVPPGGGEADYSLEMEMPAVPQVGDYISVERDGQVGTEDFIVRRSWWHFKCTQDGENGKTTGITVECEFAKGAYSSEDHQQACDRYFARYGAKEFEATAY